MLKKGDIWTTRAGTYALELIGVHGTSANPIVIDAYGTGEKLNISGTEIIIKFNSGTTSVMSYYVEIKNLQLVSTGPPAYVIRIPVSGTPTTTPHHLTFDGLFIDGGVVGIENGTQTSDLTIKNCYIQNISDNTISTCTPRMLITNNTFTNVGWAGNSTIYCVGNVDSVVITNNLFEDCNRGISLVNGNEVWIEDNTFTNMTSGAAIGISSRAQGTGTYLGYLK